MLKFHTSFGHDLQPWLGIWDLRGFVWGFADEIWGHQLWTFTGGCGLWPEIKCMGGFIDYFHFEDFTLQISKNHAVAETVAL